MIWLVAVAALAVGIAVGISAHALYDAIRSSR